MRKFFFLLFPLLLISCYGAGELDYDGDGKIIFEGRVIDQNGVPLPNIMISTYLSNYDDHDYISYTQTNENGYYKMAFNEPLDADYVAVLINQKQIHEQANPLYSVTTIHNIYLDGRHGHKINFENTSLFTLNDYTTLTLNFEESNWEYPLINLEGLVHYNFIDYDLPYLGIIDYQYNEFLVAKNQVIKLKRQVINQSGIYSITEEDIVINSEPVTYQLD